jgi:CAAX prenyl protease-like protein
MAKTFVGVWLIYEMWPYVREMRYAFSWDAVWVGVLVCVVWVGIDAWYPKLGKAGTPWNPHQQFGEGSALAWFYIIGRTLGSTLVVPCLEEVFYRSFLYRYMVKVNFLEMPFKRMHGLSFVVTSVIFGLVHYQWLAGIFCGMAYQWLAWKKDRLGDAMTAHAITNFLLAIWIVWKSDYQFW